MTAINGLTFKGDQEQRSGGILFPVVGGAVVGGAAGLAIRGTRKPNLEGVSADTFEKTMAGVTDLTDDQKSAVKTIKEHLAGNKSSEETTEAKAEKADAEAGAKAEGKGGKTPKPSVAAGGMTVENLFGNAEEIDPMKFLQEKYGYGNVQELIDGIKADRIALGGPEGKALRTSIKSGTKGQLRDEKTFSKVEQGIKQEIAIKELEQRIAEEKFKVEGMTEETKAGKAEKAIAQRRVDTMEKTLQNQQDRLAKFEADLKDNKAYQEMKKAFEAKSGTEKDAKAYQKATNAAENAGQHAKKELTEKIKADAGKKAEKEASRKKLKGTERQDFIKKAQDEAVAANKERIEKYVELQKQKEFFKRARNEYSEGFKSYKREAGLDTKKSLIGSQRELSKQEASLLEKEKDLELIRDAKKNGKKITKTQAQANMDLAAAKAKDGIAKVAKEAGEKAGKAGSESKGVTAGIEDALKTLKDKLPKEFKKWNNKAMLYGAGIGVVGALVLKWMFGGKSEPEA